MLGENKFEKELIKTFETEGWVYRKRVIWSKYSETRRALERRFKSN